VRAKGGGVARLLLGDVGFTVGPAPFVDAVKPSDVLALADSDSPDDAAAAFIGIVGFVLGGMAICFPWFSRSTRHLLRR
jgi:hypothetical protein